MADANWGQLADCESYGKAGDKKEDYKVVTFETAISKDYEGYQHGAHAMLFARDQSVLWDLYTTKAAVLMQLRFDGMLGFPGGLVDPGEDPLKGVNRELEEEIGLDLGRFAIGPENHVVSNVHQAKNLVLHFFAKEVSMEDFTEIERKNLEAPDYGSEVLGVIRPPLFTMGDGYRGFPAFLSNHFAGNAREQLLLSLIKTKILEQVEVTAAVDAFENFRKSNS